MAKAKKNYTLPMIPVRGLVVFPNMVLHFDVARERSIAALEEAMKSDQLIFLASQENVAVETPKKEDIYEIGVVARIKQLLKAPGGTIRVLVEGLYRAKTLKLDFTENAYIGAKVKVIDETKKEFDEKSYEAITRRIQSLLKKVSLLTGQVNVDVINNISIQKDPGQFADSIATNVFAKVSDKQEVLNEADVEKRIEKVIEILSREAEVYEIEKNIATKTKKQIDKNQKDYLLREQMKAIRAELGEEESEEDEYREIFDKKYLPKEVRAKVEKELKRLSSMPFGNAEIGVIKGWLDLIGELPFEDEKLPDVDLNKAMEVLERDHYGLTKVKERIIEYLAVTKLSESKRAPILCLYGPPGVGKTSIAKSIAASLGREYVRMSLGGVRDEAEIRGHRKTYVGAMPGRIINAIKQAKSKNALILLDEIDKLGSDFKGDPASALLEVLDGAQNFSFRDHYLEVPFDLSGVLFVTTANNIENIPHALLDRLEMIEITGYTPLEKKEIAKNYLIPRQMKENGLKKGNVKIADGVIEAIIDGYTRESGVRNLEREIGTVLRKAATLIVKDNRKSVSVTTNNLNKFLGTKKYLKDSVHENPAGVVTGLAWTSVGGVTLTVEATVMEGQGKLELTGSLGDVMKESAKAAISFIRKNAALYGIDPAFYKNDIHIHVPEGATPKDGPSAGITITTALISALTERSVKKDVAMTGEITLSGRVLAIGGLKEKLLAAKVAGAKTIIIPYENKRNLLDIPKEILDGLTIYPVKNMKEVSDIALGEFERAQVIPTVSQSVMAEITN